MFIESLKGKTIAVTGAASGIGKRTSELLIEAGARVVALDRNEPNFAVERFLQIDLADPESIDAAVASIASLPLQGLCNIAGVPGTLPDTVVARVNYLGLRRLATALLPQMQRGSAVVNIASVAGSRWREHTEKYVELARIAPWDDALAWIDRNAFLKTEAYRRYKEALIVWSQATAGAWLSGHGVRMNCVSPGPVDTPILDDFRASLGQKNVADLIELTGRPGNPDDIAPVVVFLLTDAARWICGLDVVCDGGLSSMRFAAGFPVSASV